MTSAASLVRLPMYQQLNALLRELLDSGAYPGDQQFLTERQIVERFGVSRPTANKALAALVGEGRLDVRKGIGTFVRGRRLDYDIRSLVSFTRKAEQAGRRPSTKVIEFEPQPAEEAGPGVTAALSLSAAEPVYAMVRLRLADNEPVILERRWVPVRLCRGLTRKDLKGSIYSLWVEKYRLPITEADQVIRAVNLSKNDAHLLGVRGGAAGFLVSATGYSRGAALWYEQTLYRGDSYEFHHHRPAAGRLRQLPASGTYA